jgi:hypothetical protein
MNNEQQIPEVFTFIAHLPIKCQTADQMKAVLKCRFQRELDDYFDTHVVKVINDEDNREKE